MIVPPERTQAGRLPDWMEEKPGLHEDIVEFYSQLTPDELLFKRWSQDGQASRNFVIYDKKRRLPRHFDPPDNVWDTLRGYRQGDKTLRWDAEEECHFFCEGTLEFRYIAPDCVRSACFYLGVGKDGQRRNIRISTLFVTPERLLLVDIDRGLLISLDKRAVIRALREDRAGRGWVPLEIHQPAFDQRMFPFGYPRREGGAVHSSYDESAAYFAELRSTWEVQFPRVHVFDLRNEALRDYEWPVLHRTDLAYLHGLYERRPALFRTYLAVLPFVEGRYSAHTRQPPGGGMFWLEDHVVFSRNKILELRLGEAGTEASAAFPGPADTRILDLYSPVRESRKRGIIESLKRKNKWDDPTLREHLLRRYTLDELADMLEEEIDSPRPDPEFLLRTAETMERYPRHTELAIRWLGGSTQKRLVAVRLLEGTPLGPGEEPAAEDAEESKDLLFADRRAFRLRPEDLPLEVLQRVADEALEAARGASTGPREMASPPGSDLTLSLIRRILITAVSWQSKEAMTIVRTAASQGILGVDRLLADLIRDGVVGWSTIRASGIGALRDIALDYLGHRDAAVVTSAIKALEKLEADEAEDGLIGLLGASDRVITAAASEALGSIGSGCALTALSYADIIECYSGERRIGEEQEVREAHPRPGTSAKRAIDLLLGKLVMEFDLNPGRAGRKIALEDMRRILVESTILSGYRNESREYRGRADAAGNRRLRRDTLLERIEEYPELGCLRERMSAKLLRSLSSRGIRKRRTVLELLKWHMEAHGAGDLLYRVALIFHLTPGYLRFDWRSSVARRIGVCLDAIYERMQQEEDFRGILAVFALVELGAGEKWERRALEVFEKGDWRGWPRLMRAGIRALRRLPEEARLPLHEALLKDIGGGPGYEKEIADLAESDPRVAIRLYERGAFSLSRVDAALLYGRIGDRRGYEDVLRAPTGTHDRRTIDYLRKFGGPEAEPVIEAGLYRWRPLGDVVEGVLEELKKNRT
jgi:hypothetical protein